MGSEPVLCSRDGKIFVLRMESQDLITDGTPRWVTARRRGVDDAHGSSWTVTACDCPGGRGTGRVLPLVLGCPEGQRSLTVQRPVAPASGSVGPLLCPPHPRRAWGTRGESCMPGSWSSRKDRLCTCLVTIFDRKKYLRGYLVSSEQREAGEEGTECLWSQHRSFYSCNPTSYLLDLVLGYRSLRGL